MAKISSNIINVLKKFLERLEHENNLKFKKL